MDKLTKNAILQQGLDRIESYRKVIESIQMGYLSLSLAEFMM